MAVQSANHGLVLKARDALGRLAGLAITGESARAAAAEIDRDWARTPRVAAIGGPSPARAAAFLDHLCGGGVIDPAEVRWPRGLSLRLRRGATTRLRGVRPDGGEDVVLAREPEADAVDAGQSALLARRDLLRAEVAAREAALERASLALPRPLRRRPPLWAVWSWLLRWVLALVWRRRLEDARRALAELNDSRRRLAALSAESATQAAVTEARRGQLASRLRAALAGRDPGGWREIHLELERGPLEPGVELVLRGGAPEPDADATLVVEGDQVLAYSGAAGGAVRRLGGYAEAAEALAGFLADARALRLAARARTELTAGATALQQAIARAEDGFRARIERIEALRVTDREAFVAAQLERVRPLVIERGSLVLQQATSHFEAELARVASEWSAAVSAAGSGDELSEAVDRIDEEALGVVQEVAAEVERLISAGLAGGAHDLHPALVEELVARGLPDGGEEPAVPPPQAVALAAALGDSAAGKLGGSARWLQALFRSLDSRRSDLLERIEQRRAKLHELGMAALYGAEPAVRDALVQALAVHLQAALDRHAAWIERALADETAAIERERAALEPLARARDAAHRDERELAERMAQLEASYPPA